MKGSRSPCSLHKLFPKSSKVCWPCITEECIIFHIFCSCLMICFFSEDMSPKFTGYLLLNPALFLSHDSSIPKPINKNSLFFPNTVKWCIPVYWKNTFLPLMQLCLHTMEKGRQLEVPWFYSPRHDTWLCLGIFPLIHFRIFVFRLAIQCPLLGTV